MTIEPAMGETAIDGVSRPGPGRRLRQAVGGAIAARYRRAGLHRGRRADAVVALLYLLTAFLVTSRLWISPTSRVAAENARDHVQFQFFFAHAARSVTHLTNPFFSTQLNAPEGVNMLANTSWLGITVPMVPVTLLFGPAVSVTLALTLVLAATGLAWYAFLRRHVTSHRLAAFAGAGLCAFGPGFISHANGHPNWVGLFMVPLIVSRVLRLWQAPRRHGLILSAMVIYQYFLNPEVLFLTAMACAIVIGVWALSHRRQALVRLRPFAGGLGLAAAVAAIVLAYPLWFQFFGPGHYRGPFRWAADFYLDLMAYPATGPRALGGRAFVKAAIPYGQEEINAFLGWPLCILAIVTGVLFWRNLAARVASVLALVFGALSLGRTIEVNRRSTGIPGPWRLFENLPVFDSIIMRRFALIVTIAVGILLAVACDFALRALPALPDGLRRPARVLSCGALIAILAPAGPVPIAGRDPEPIPELFTSGAWQELVDDGTVVSVPPSDRPVPPMTWLVSTNLEMRLVGGYFLGPTSPTDRTAKYGLWPRPTGTLLSEVAKTGKVPAITKQMRDDARADLAAWQADLVVLNPSQRNEERLRATVDALLGRRAVQRGGLWIWDVRSLN